MTVRFLSVEVFCLAALVLFWTRQRRKETKTEIGGSALALLFVLAFAVRAWYASRDIWFGFDVGCFKSWGDLAYDGLKLLYNSGRYVDYPPFAMYFFAVAGGIRELAGLSYESVEFTFLIKLVGIASDIGMCALVYACAKSRLDRRRALLLAAFWAFCPMVIYDSSVWGQIDGLLMVLLALTVMLLAEDRPASAGIACRAALMTKPQAILTGPVLLYCMIAEKDNRKLMKAVCAGIISIILIVLPFTQGLDISWIVTLYRNTLKSYGMFTVNGYNLYYLLDLNWKEFSAFPAGRYINWVVIPLCLALYGCAFRKLRRKYANGGAMFICAYMYIVTVFCLCTMMHERYMFCAAGFALMAYIYTQKDRMLYLFLLSSACSFLNSAAVFVSYHGETTSRSMGCFIALLTMACLAASLVFLFRETAGADGEKAAREGDN